MFFLGGQSVGVSGQCFFCFFLCFVFLVVFGFFSVFLSRQKQGEKKNTTKKSKKKRSPEKKGVTPGPPGRQPSNPPSLCIGEIWCLLKPYFAIYKYT